MFKKFTKSVLFSMLLLSVISCSSKEDEKNEVVPAAKSELSRTFTYSEGTDNETNTAEYSGPYVITVVRLADGKLEFSFSTTFPAGRDRIYFDVAQAKLSSGYKGTYSLKSLPDPALGVASVQYTYQREVNSGSFLSSSTNTMTGSLVITDFSEKHQLISGTYQVRLDQVFDPTRSSINLADQRKCDIVISGKFENIKIGK